MIIKYFYKKMNYKKTKLVNAIFSTNMSSSKKYIPANELLQFKTYNEELNNKSPNISIKRKYKNKIQSLCRNPQVKCEGCFSCFTVIPNTTLWIDAINFIRKTNGEKLLLIRRTECPKCFYFEEMMICGFDTPGYYRLSDNLKMIMTLNDAKDKFSKIFGISDWNESFYTNGKSIDPLTKILIERDQALLRNARLVRQMINPIVSI